MDWSLRNPHHLQRWSASRGKTVPASSRQPVCDCACEGEECVCVRDVSLNPGEREVRVQLLRCRGLTFHIHQRGIHTHSLLLTTLSPTLWNVCFVKPWCQEDILLLFKDFILSGCFWHPFPHLFIYFFNLKAAGNNVWTVWIWNKVQKQEPLFFNAWPGLRDSKWLPFNICDHTCRPMPGFEFSALYANKHQHLQGQLLTLDLPACLLCVHQDFRRWCIFWNFRFLADLK